VRTPNTRLNVKFNEDDVTSSGIGSVIPDFNAPVDGGLAGDRAGGANPTPMSQGRPPLPEGYGIRTGLGDLLKPLNSQFGVTAKEDSPTTLLVMVIGIAGLFLWYWLLLLINNQSVLLPPEDEFDEYVANFLPYFFFGEK